MTWLDWDGARIDPGWQGIRYLELALAPAPPAVPQTATLTVHLNLAPSGISDKTIEVRSATGETVPLTGFAVGPGAKLVLDLAAVDSFADHYVSLADGGNDPLHPFFATAAFNFKLFCERGDCHPALLTAPRSPETPPAVDLVTKDYEGFVHLLCDRVATTNPHWADLAPASLERMLLELVAHHGDMLSYYQDRVANEAFLDDATQRHSLRQHGVLLGYDLDDGDAARTVLAFTVQNDGYLPAELEVETARAPGEPRLVFFLPERVRVMAQHNTLRPAAWPGAAEAFLRAGATEILLWGHYDQLEPGQRLAFTQGAITELVTIRERSRGLMLPGWSDKPDPVPPDPTPKAVTRVVFEPALARAFLPFKSTFALFGNLADARHGDGRRAVRNAVPQEGDVVLSLGEVEAVTARSVTGDVIVRSVRLPERPVLFETDAEGRRRPMVRLEVGTGDAPWTLRPHLFDSASFDHHYVANSDADGSLWIHFGDDRHGRAVKPTDELEVFYRVGDPMAGNCAAHRLREVVTPRDLKAQADLAALGDVAVTNVVPGAAGRQPESLDAARLAIPTSLRHGVLRRAVTLDDYASAARQVRRVARAAARHLGGPFNTALVLVDPENQVELDEDLALEVGRHIDRLRMTGREVFVKGPVYVPLDVELAVCAQPEVPSHRTRDAVLASLRPGSKDRPGFFHPDRLSFGEDLELGDLLAHVQSVPGVRSVKALTFRRLRVALDPPVSTRIELGATEVARLDADDDRPENGRLRVRLVETDGVDPALFDMEVEP